MLFMHSDSLQGRTTKGQKLGKISNSLNTIHTTWEGLDYFSVEVTDVTGTEYLIEAYGRDAIELYSETFPNKSN
jgi:hypothetical protein